MSNYRFLNLPTRPLITKNIQQLAEASLHSDSYECFENVENFFLPSVLETFEQLGVKPVFFASFATNNVAQGSIETRMTHHDIYHNAETDTWDSIPFGINWEITPGVTTFHWWDIPGQPFLPATAENVPDNYKLLNGAHYGSRGRFGIPEGASLIEKVQVTAPILVRTDLPHSVSFNTTAKTRYNISLRFSIKDIPTWDHALKVFEPLFV